jgi:hypothetical protein
MTNEEDIDKDPERYFSASDPPSRTLGIERAAHIDQSEHETQELRIPDNDSKDLQPVSPLSCPRVV